MYKEIQLWYLNIMISMHDICKEPNSKMIITNSQHHEMFFTFHLIHITHFCTMSFLQVFGVYYDLNVSSVCVHIQNIVINLNALAQMSESIVAEEDGTEEETVCTKVEQRRKMPIP